MITKIEKISEELQRLEYSLKLDWGLNKISGAFVHLAINSIDEELNTVYLTCKSGVQNDVENDVIEEELEMNLETLKLK
jgi:hypothetical protein